MKPKFKYAFNNPFTLGISDLSCASVDDHIPGDDNFDYHTLRECNIYFILPNKTSNN